MPGPDGPDGPHPEAAAERYAQWLRAAAEPQDRTGVPSSRTPQHITTLLPGIPRACSEVNKLPLIARGVIIAASPGQHSLGLATVGRTVHRDPVMRVW